MTVAELAGLLITAKSDILTFTKELYLLDYCMCVLFGEDLVVQP